MLRTRILFFAALSLALVSTAHAQDGRREPGNFRLYGGPWFGFGGELDLDVEGPLGGTTPIDEDLTTTFGGQLGVDFVLHRYVALGAEFRIAGVNTEQGDEDEVDRSRLYDVVLKPRARYPFAKVPLELYLTVPVGLTVARFADELPNVDAIDERVGWNLGVGGGVTYFVLPFLGINVEPIWMIHKFKADGPLGFDGTFTMKQFNLLLNAVFAF